MYTIIKFTLFLSLIFTLVGCTTTQKIRPPAQSSTPKQNVQVYSANNQDGKLNAHTVEIAFEKAGLTIVGNNDMNKPFQARFAKTYYKHYNLAMFINNDITFRLIKKYPQFGALTPLTMSIYTKSNTINIATLTRNGMARAAHIPLDDPDLISYEKLIKKALHLALPDGHFKALHFQSPNENQSYQVNFTTPVKLEDDGNWDDYIEDFEAEFEAEMEPYGFLFPNFMNLQEEIFEQHDYNRYDFYHTYSICKFDVIFPVSKLHPEAGAWAPCSFYIYKLKNENKIHMGFLGVNNWIHTLNIKDMQSIQPLQKAQSTIVKILNEITQ